MSSAADGTDSKQDNKDVIISGNTEIREAAQTLTDKLIEYAWKDKKSFEKLFRNTESSVIEQYYNTSYDNFKKYDKSLIAIAAENAVMCKVTEIYTDINNNVQITLYVSNGTGKDIGLTGVEITTVDGDTKLFSKHFDMEQLVVKDTATAYTLTIPSEELDFTTRSSPKITDFKFNYE